MNSDTLAARRRLYLLARALVARYYRRSLTLAAVAEALGTSHRQLQRVYAECGDTTFQEDLFAKRMAVAAELLIEQRAIPVCDVARLVGYGDGSHFARAFRRRYGLAPARFRAQARTRGRPVRTGPAGSVGSAGSAGLVAPSRGSAGARGTAGT